MTIMRITPTAPVCLGVCCAQHASCNRYALVDGANDATPRIATCADGGEFPLFVELPKLVHIEVDHGPGQLQFVQAEVAL